jgi:probable rRNA maturation factor
MPSPEGSSVRFRRIPASLRRAAIERFARRLQKDVAKGRAFDVLITGDAELRRLNRDFRRQDYATDVLSFPTNPEPNGNVNSPQRRRVRRDKRRENREQAEGKGQDSRLGAEQRFLGDVAISLGRARAQAREFGHSIEQEVQILMLHGVLHLCGHDHEADSGAMARAEKRWRAKLGLPNGLIERVRS